MTVAIAGQVKVDSVHPGIVGEDAVPKQAAQRLSFPGQDFFRKKFKA